MLLTQSGVTSVRLADPFSDGTPTIWTEVTGSLTGVESGGVSRKDRTSCTTVDIPYEFCQNYCGDRLHTSELDVCRRQALTSTDGPRNERIKIFIMALDPGHKYSNESERAN